MFNRALQVKVIKNEKKDLPASSQTDSTFEGKTAIIGNFLERITDKAVSGVVAYILLDTLRQVLVARASRK